jgi:L-lactate dehydrogenase complex protein LldG
MSAAHAESRGVGHGTAELDALLARLRQVRAAATPAPLPTDPSRVARQVSADANLPAVFIDAARKSGMQVHDGRGGDWAATLATVLQTRGAQSVVADFDSLGDARLAARVEAALEAAGCAVTTNTADETLFTVDAAVTGVQAAIAETGSLVWSAAAGAARGTTLIPPAHIAFVRVGQILPDLCDFYGGALRPDQMPAHATLITGPSKTADIEGIIITGVHGPGTVDIILVD